MPSDEQIIGERVRKLETEEFWVPLVGSGDPNGVVPAAESTPYWDYLNNVFYINNDGATGWTMWPGGGGAAVPHTLLNNPWHTDTATNTPPAAGSIIVSTAGFTWSETVHPGAAAQFLRANAAIPGWAAIVAGDLPNLGALPALTYTTANAAGAASTYVRTDADLAIFDAVNPEALPVGSSSTPGVAAFAARRDHKHTITPATPVDIGIVNNGGIAVTFVRSDHVHKHPSGLGTDLHHAEVHVVNSTGPHAEAGLTVGHVLRASGAAAFSFAAIQTADLPAIPLPGTLTVSTVNNGSAPHLHTVTSSSNPGAAASLLASDASGGLYLDTNLLAVDGANNRVGIRVTVPNHPLSVPWIAGDATGATAFFGSVDVANNQTAIEAITNSAVCISATAVGNIAIQGTSTSSNGVYGVSTSGYGARGVSSSSRGVSGESTTGIGVAGTSSSDVGVTAQSATGTAFIANATGVAIAIADFQDNGTPVLTVQDGGAADFAEYIRHLGDTDTYLRYQTDRATLVCGGVTMIDAVKAATDYLNLHAGLVGINETANTKMTIGLTIDQGASDDEIVNLRSSDVGAVSTTAETGTFLSITKAQGSSGGSILRAYKDADGANYAAMIMTGYLAEDTDTTKTTAARAIVETYGYQTDGAAVENTVANGNIFAIRTQRGGSVLTVGFWDEDGDYYYNGALNAYDDERDEIAAWDLSHVLAGEWSKIIEYGADKLEKMGVIGPADKTGSRMVSNKRMNALQLGAIGQGYLDRMALREEVRQLRKQCQRYELALSRAGLLPA